MRPSAANAPIPARDPPVNSQRLLTGLLIAALGAFATLTVVVFLDDTFRAYVDSAIYILCAKSLAAGEGYLYQGRPFFVRPPALSWLMTPFVADPIDYRTLNLIIQLFVAGTFLTVALAMRRLHGLLLGLVVTLLFAINPLAVAWQNIILAEYPFMLLFFGGAWLVMPRKPGEAASWRRGLLGAVLMSASAYFRSTSLLAVPALVLVDVFRKGSGRWRGVVFAAVLLGLHLPWMIWSGQQADQAERPSTQLKMFDYPTALFRVDTRDPDSAYASIGDWRDRFVTNFNGITGTLGVVLLGQRGVGGGSTFLTLIVAGAMIFTWLSRRSLLDWYMMSAGAFLFLYFIYVDRFLLPLLPLILSSLLYTAQKLGEWSARQIGDPRAARLVVLILVGLIAVPSFAGMERALRYPAARAATDHADRQTGAWLAENTPPDAVILSDRQAIVSVLSGRLVWGYRNLVGPGLAGVPRFDYAVMGPSRLAIESVVARHAIEKHVLPLRFRNEEFTMRIYRIEEGWVPDEKGR
jgi:4-amino-4-deoxy-L-arabinose transferase-like glycosyltransferase